MRAPSSLFEFIIQIIESNVYWVYLLTCKHPEKRRMQENWWRVWKECKYDLFTN